MKIPSTLAALTLFAAAPAALADTLKVPSEYGTIQAAVDAAQSGDRVVIAAGNYTENVWVTGKSDLEIRGSGWPVLLGPGALLRVEAGSNGVLVRGLEFDNAPIQVANSSGVVLTKLRIHDVATAIATDNSGLVVISKCDFQDTSDEAIVDTDSDGFRVEKCRFTAISGWAVALTPVASIGTMNAVISKNRIVNAGGGVFLGGTGSVVEKNRMEGLVLEGVQGGGFVSTAGADILKNRISTATEFAITGTYGGYFIEKNTLYGGGIYIEGPGHFVDGNRVYNASGIGIRAVNIASLSRNTVREPNGDGILVEGDGSDLDRNSVVDGSVNGIVILGDGCTIDRCSSTRAHTYGFYVLGTGNTFTRCKARGSGELDLADANAQGVNTYEGNHFGTTAFNWVP
jgi:hypothetical protein